MTASVRLQPTLAQRLVRVWRAWSRDDWPTTEVQAVPVRQRVVAAAIVGLIAGIFCWLCAQRPGSTPDFAYPLQAAKHFLAGGNPYDVQGGGIGADPDATLIFPFTTVLAAVPFAWALVDYASALFLGLSSALLAFAITRDGLWRLHVFASAPFVMAAVLAQFTPLLTAMALIPALGFAAVLKPHIGFAVLVSRPTVQALLGCVAALALSLLVFPSWPMEWLAALRGNTAESGAHLMPVMQFGGFLLLLAVVSWRSAAGRLLLVMSLTPQLLFFYDALPLWLIPRTRQQSIFLTAASQASMVVWALTTRPGEVLILSAAAAVTWLIYIPALVLVLWQRRPT